MYNNNISQNAKNIVLSFIRELNEQDFASARQYVDNNLHFDSVIGMQEGAAAYFKDIKHLLPEYDIKNIFCEGDDVCLIYNFKVSGMVIFGCGLYHVTNNKIDTVKVVFDPRPLLELTASN